MLTRLQKDLRDERKDKTIFDLVLYGSSVKGKTKPGDVDLAVIFRSGTLRERLEKVQRIKRKITLPHRLDIKALLWEELFQEEFFGRTGLFLEGISVWSGTPFSYRIGFEGAVLFSYELRNKSHTEKVKFNYVLGGRNGKGMLEKLGGKRQAPGAVMIPMAKALEFEEVLQTHGVAYSKKNILVQM
ncbi:nucleotidyltransferase domain-containing protein [Candidatus Woesearchaeota archaeon]|nr:nucleotidyltransferase domain-containing protein [Candidatus Woesearchaeota archaeon]